MNTEFDLLRRLGWYVNFKEDETNFQIACCTSDNTPKTFLIDTQFVKSFGMMEILNRLSQSFNPLSHVVAQIEEQANATVSNYEMSNHARDIKHLCNKALEISLKLAIATSALKELKAFQATRQDIRYPAAYIAKMYSDTSSARPALTKQSSALYQEIIANYEIATVEVAA